MEAGNQATLSMLLGSKDNGIDNQHFLVFFPAGSTEFGWKNRGRSAIDTCLFPWHHDGLPTAEELLETFHINPLLRVGR